MKTPTTSMQAIALISSLIASLSFECMAFAPSSKASRISSSLAYGAYGNGGGYMMDGGAAMGGPYDEPPPFDAPWSQEGGGGYNNEWVPMEYPQFNNNYPNNYNGYPANNRGLNNIINNNNRMGSYNQGSSTFRPDYQDYTPPGRTFFRNSSARRMDDYERQKRGGGRSIIDPIFLSRDQGSMRYQQQQSQHGFYQDYFTDE